MAWADYTYLTHPAFLSRINWMGAEEERLASLTPGEDYWRNSVYWTRMVEYPWVLMSLEVEGKPPDFDIKVLDAGGGAATFQYYLSKFVSVYNIDYLQSEVDVAMRYKILGEYDNLHIELGDIRDIQYEDNFFDHSVCISVVEHNPPEDVYSSIEELVRVTSGLTLITMDVSLEEGDDRFNLDHLKVLTDKYDIPYPPLKRTTMMSFDHPWGKNLEYNFGIALIGIEKGEETLKSS